MFFGEVFIVGVLMFFFRGFFGSRVFLFLGSFFRFIVSKS